MKTFTFHRQLESKDCGPACLKMIAEFHGKRYSIEHLRNLSRTTRAGSNLAGLSEAAEAIGLRSIGAMVNQNQLAEIKVPCICHWEKNHFVVLYKIRKGVFFVADPAVGKISYGKKDFAKSWAGKVDDQTESPGIVLTFEPSNTFLENESEKDTSGGNLGFLFEYVKNYKSFFWQLGLGIVIGSCLQIALPFLMQGVVDVGIRNQDISFIYLILLAQLFVFAGRAVVGLIRSWILMHLGTKINISLLSDFLMKIMKLPIAFFESRMTGDLLLRMNDHYKIERMLTVSSLDILFSSLNLVVFGCVLAYFNFTIFLIFLVGTLIHFGWVFLFMKKRAILDHRRFSEEAKEQSKIIELINGMAEIKLHNAERSKRWGWEEIQARLFKLDIKELRLEQSQFIGAGFLNEIKNVVIIGLASILVVEGGLTLGQLLAISFITGQLNGPVSKMVEFTRELQDARLSFARLNEIHNKKNEGTGSMNDLDSIESGDITIDGLSFSYQGQTNPVLMDINMVIPYNKVTAIVGPSGCGKTTLLKLLLKFHEPTEGAIRIDDVKLNYLNPQAWRDYCGAVMQDGYLFNESILDNIIMAAQGVDHKKLSVALKTANLVEFIDSLPYGYETKLGGDGIGLSGGQKQRILIARAVYKAPELLVFDEATSALDARNERIISDRLSRYFENRTVVIAAHRLNTVIRADHVIVLDNGRIVENGTHEILYGQKGHYYNLVRDQVEFAK